MSSPKRYDAILIISFGGPERPDDVLPFLENVLRGRNVPRQRMLEVAEHYYEFGGVSPLNEQNRALIAALQRELAEHGPNLPVYWGNRNWHPLLTDTMQEMKLAGVRRALALVTSAYSSYSGCRQYLEDIERARQVIGDNAPHVDKLRAFFNHPGFIEASAERVRSALRQVPDDRLATTQLVYTAHSIPEAMSESCQYVPQLKEASRLVSEAVGHHDTALVFQSRSGPPTQPWLEPDVCDYLRQLKSEGQITDVVLVPIGFISDHMEILFDLDTEARGICDQLELNLVRAETVGCHPRFIRMIRELILERTSEAPRLCLGTLGPSHDQCPEDCCPLGRPTRGDSTSYRPT